MTQLMKLSPGCIRERTLTDAKTKYPGSGTMSDPYIVDWDVDDPESPYNWSTHRKWAITMQLAISSWTVSFCSSSYSGGLAAIAEDLHISHEVAILGVSLYVLGFGLGPIVFAPLGEVFGRRPVFLCTYSVFVLFLLGGALCRSIGPLLACRLLAGIFGSSPLTNASGTLADIWIARERGMAAALYATAPFLGPAIGPVVGGWIVETSLGWRFNLWIMLICASIALILGVLLLSETFSPVLLRKRARKLMEASESRIQYVSKYDVNQTKSLKVVLQINLKRPFVFLATEPIVVLMAVYIGITYATLYSFFAAYPIVFQEHRHFSPGEGGLAFLGVGLGVLIGTSLTPVANRLYWRAADRSETGKAPPEARLYLPMMGGLLLPIGLFWFAWTTEPSVHWIVPILAGCPFGIGVAQIMQGLTQYLIDTYTIYCSSAIASTVVLRSLLAAIFPLVSPRIYAKLGDQWAVSIFAFLALACMPLPFIFFKYGAWVRSKSKFANNHSMASPIATQLSHQETLREKEQDSQIVPELGQV